MLSSSKQITGKGAEDFFYLLYSSALYVVVVQILSFSQCGLFFCTVYCTVYSYCTVHSVQYLLFLLCVVQYSTVLYTVQYNTVYSVRRITCPTYRRQQTDGKLGFLQVEYVYHSHDFPNE